MPGITIAAMLTIGLLLILVVLLICTRLHSSIKLLTALGVLGGMAAFFGAFYLLRIPLDAALQSLNQSNPVMYRLGTTLYAPITEEPAKWLVLIPFFLAGKIKHENKAVWAMCIGIGFGIGEIVFLSQRIAADPQTLTMPWYLSSGFMVERFMVSLIHSALVLIAVDALCSRKLWGLILAPVVHFLVNLPIFLSRQYPLDPMGVLWGQLLWLSNILFFIGALIYLGLRMFPQAQRAAR